MACNDCGFGYRTSIFKRNPDRWVVLSVTFALTPSELSMPLTYAELARTLDVGVGERAGLAATRSAVLSLRSGKGMVLDPADPDTRSVGSFFTNPIVTQAVADEIAGRAGEVPPQWPDSDGYVKLSAAWLVQRAGFTRGFGAGSARVSSKHTLALTNPSNGTTEDLLTLAREIRDRVRDQLGVTLSAEPVLIGCSL